MRVAIFTAVDLGALGGIETSMKSMYPYYRKHDIDCEYFVPFSNRDKNHFYDFPLNILPPGVFSKGFKSSLYRSIILKNYLKLFVKNKFDILHIQCAFPAGVVLSEFIGWLGIPAILHCRAVDIQKCDDIGYGARQDSAVDSAVRNTVNCYDKYIVTNSNIKEILREMRVKDNDIDIIHNGTDTKRFSCSVDRNAIRTKLGCSENDTVFISVGRNHPVKGYEFALRSFAKLKEFGNFKYIIFGAGITELSSLVNELQLNNHVILNEALQGKELDQAMLGCDAYILPSLIEGFPLVKAEAFAAGLPVITTDRPGCRDFIIDNKTGLIVSERNNADFSAAIKNVLDNPALLKEMKNNCLSSSHELDWDSIVKRYKDVYLTLLESKS
jgi:glycosyltransferase involved in cell wall biosynthesis